MITLEITVAQQEMIHAALEHALGDHQDKMTYPEVDKLKTLIEYVKQILLYDCPFHAP